MDATLPGIRQSDMQAFRRCRRQWDYTSGLRRNLAPAGQAIGHFWFGTGMHFALEDYHGYNRFGDPRAAFRAYVAAFDEAQLPPNWEEFPPLGESMLAYYLESWLPRRDEYRTHRVGGKPQVEVNWKLPIPGVANPISGTFDRIVEDPYGRLYVWDWKMMAQIDVQKLDNDFQVSTYLWAAEQLYGQIEGMLYVQFRKVVPRGPARLKDAPDGTPKFSKAIDAPVSHGSYSAALMETFGRIPDEYVAHLNRLADLEDADGDIFIRRTLTRRNIHAIRRHGWAIAAQAAEMTYPHLAVYPNPTKDCKYCAFRSPCLAADEGADEEYLLREGYVSRDVSDEWRARIAWPAEAAAS